MKELIAIFVSMCSFVMGLHAQDTVYLDADLKKVDKDAGPVYYRVSQKMKGDEGVTVRNTYFSSGQQRKYEQYRTTSGPDNAVIQFGEEKKWYRSGQLQWSANYEDNKLHGQVTSYWENGQMRRRDVYANGELVSGKTWDENGLQVAHYPFATSASFPGGPAAYVKYMNNNLQYPETAQKQGIEGRVLLQFVVEADGTISEIKVLRSAHKLLESEALRLIKKMPDWIPATSERENVRSHFQMPIVFKLS